jgi:Asparagine synthase
MLMLDREPMRWGHDGRSGLAWAMSGARAEGAGDWREASRRGANGLAIEGRHRFLHSSIDGLEPLYWIDDGGAIYFASRIAPLVEAAPGLLSVDWDAWASIVAVRFPSGERTPFAEVRRLEPFSTLSRRFGRFRSRSPTWPWAEVEPHLDLGEGAEALLAGLREAVAQVRHPVLCPLSGGRDSRMVLCLLAETGAASVALTVSDDEGDTYEEDLAAPVAAAVGLPHERLPASPDDYPADWVERARRVEHQFVDHAWLVPLARRVDGAGVPLGDGIVIDSLLQRGSRFYTSETLDHRRGRRSNLAMFDSLRRYGLAHLALDESFHEPLIARAREQFVDAVRPFEGNPCQANLGFFRTRTVRGISTYPTGLLGRGTQTLMPGAADAVAVAALATTPEARSDDGLYPAVFELLNRRVGALPSTSDTPRRPPRLPRRWCSAPAVDAHRERIAAGPLAPYISPELRAWLRAPQGTELSADLRLGLEAISLFHDWCDLYRDRLGEIDVAELRR